MFTFILFIILSLILVFYIVIYSILLSNTYVNENDKDESSNLANLSNSYHYKRKRYLDYKEHDYFVKLLSLKDYFDINVIPNINLNTVIDRIEPGTKNELNINISFGIFSDNYTKILLLINIDQKDNKLIRKICKDAGIKYISFNNKTSADINIIKNRVSKALSDK